MEAACGRSFRTDETRGLRRGEVLLATPGGEGDGRESWCSPLDLGQVVGGPAVAGPEGLGLAVCASRMVPNPSS